MTAGQKRSGAWLFRLLLLAYPRAFRVRFGDELAEDFRRSSRFSYLAMLSSGLAERCSAVTRWVLWPNHVRHLYEPNGRHIMLSETLRSNLRFAVRTAWKSPVYTVLVIAALALGIGANGVIFTLLHSVLLRPLPYEQPDRLVMIWSDNRNESRPRNVMSPANFMDFRTQTTTVDRMDYALSFMITALIQGEEEYGRLQVFRTGTDVFRVLGRPAAFGRTFEPGERDVAVVSHNFWVRRMGSDPAVIGRKLTLSGNESVQVIGVMPPDFVFPYRSMFDSWASGPAQPADMWIPMPLEGPRWMDPAGQLIRSVHMLVAVGRLKTGVTPDQASADLNAVAARLAGTYPASNQNWGVTVVPLLDQTVGDARSVLYLLLAGVGLLLLMASVNVANLVLARCVARQRELAVRRAIGASRLQLASQAMTESVLLAIAGGVVALILVRWGVRAVIAVAPETLPRLQDVHIDGVVVLATLVVALFTGLLVGVLPAVFAGRSAVQPALKEDSRGSHGSRSRRRTRDVLVVAEVALAVVLTAGSGLLIRSFLRLVDVEAGHRPDSILTLQMSLPERLTTPAARIAFYEEMLDRLQAIPGVLSVGGTTRIPLGSSSVTTSIQVEGREGVRPLPEVEFRRSMRSYFQAMGIPVIRGRLVAAEDVSGGAPVAVINQTMAQRVFGNEDPVGRSVRMGPRPNAAWTRIVGVVGDMRHSRLDADPLPEIYVDYRTGPPVSPFLVLRTDGDTSGVAAQLRREFRAFDPSAGIFDVRTLEDIRDASVAERRFVLVLVTLFGCLALVLAAVGVYGVMTLVVEEQTAEAGVRLALGASPSHLWLSIVLRAVRLAATGCVAGVLLSIMAGPLIRNQLFGIGVADPVTIVGVPLLLVGVAALAAAIPGWRAMHIDPVRAMSR